MSYPNPEDKNAFCLALKLAKEKGCRYCTGNRSGCRPARSVCKKIQRQENIRVFTGKYVGVWLILEIYIVTAEKNRELCPENGAVVTTIVSGKMSKEIAKDYGMTLIETLTGFKYIGEQIKFF